MWHFQKGLHKWIGSMDLNSLYPSVIRALNMDPATIVGQLRPDIRLQELNEDMNLKRRVLQEAGKDVLAQKNMKQ